MESQPAANPYQAPVDLAGALAHDDSRKFYREEDFLVVRDGAELPNRCIHTNEEVPAARGRLVRKRLIWLGIFALGVAIAVIGGNFLSPDASLMAVLGGILLGFIGIVGSLVQHALTVRGHRDGRFTLKGCCPAYLNSLAD